MTGDLPKLNADNFINRELSTIDFQRRVLALAADERVPLLERVKFIAIVGNNLDEFFMVRVPSYIQKIKLGITRARPDGLPPQQLLTKIRENVSELLTEQRRLKADVLAQLAEHDIRILQVTDLTAAERERVSQYFREYVFPVLTPLAVDHARPFPFISNLSLNLGVFLARRIDGEEAIEFARIKVPVPDILPRLVNLHDLMAKCNATYAGGGQHFLWIEDIIRENLQALFPGMRVVEAYPFRVLRNADIDYEHEKEEEETIDVMSIIEQSVRERRFGFVVRLSVPQEISENMLERLIDGLEIASRQHVYTIQGALGTANLFELTSVDVPDLKYPPYMPKFNELLPPDASIFAAIRRQDVMLHHPYDSFSPVEEFFRQAAQDPDVLAIKATLYRVGKNSPIVQALMNARENEKQVTVLVELKARFDEENNLEWARAMEAKGVHVIYGVEELPVKTHAKVALVVRREAGGVRRYLHLGTGNYNASTARLYTDFGLFTCHTTLAEDASRLFNRLTGYAPQTAYDRLLVAPEYLLDVFLDLIDNEIAAAKAGKDARLIFKMNQLEEDVIIQRLYAASQAGVQIDLIVRGFCCLRPGVPGMSENIRLISILGRYLEHSRVYYFKNAPEDQRMYAGSADIMRRNLYNRVEVVYPVLSRHIQHKLLRFLATSLLDNVGAWELQADGQYTRLRPEPGEKTMRSQKVFMKNSFGLDITPDTITVDTHDNPAS